MSEMLPSLNDPSPELPPQLLHTDEKQQCQLRKMLVSEQGGNAPTSLQPRLPPAPRGGHLLQLLQSRPQRCQGSNSPLLQIWNSRVVGMNATVVKWALRPPGIGPCYPAALPAQPLLQPAIQNTSQCLALATLHPQLRCWHMMSLLTVSVSQLRSVMASTVFKPWPSLGYLKQQP